MLRPIGAFQPRLVLPLLLLAVLAGCFGDADRPRRRPGSAVWVGKDGGAVDASTLRRLEEMGAGDVFLPYAELAWESGEPRLSAAPAQELPRRSAATLVVEGPWSGEDPETAGEAFAQELKRVELEARSRGLLPTGFHLELPAGERPDLASLGEALARTRSSLNPEVLLSLGLAAPWLEDESLPAVAAAVDFLVGWVYGERPEELERSGFEDERWKLSQVDLALTRLEALDTPYLVGVVTLGTALRRGGDGRVRELTHQGELESLALSRTFRLGGEFVLSGADCRLYDFEAQGKGRFGPWTLAAGEEVRLVALTPSLLREYHRRREALDLSHRLGELYYRLPAAEETYSLSLDGLAASMEGGERSETLPVRVEEWSGRGGTYQLRLSLSNPLPEATEIATLDANYVEVHAKGGAFGTVGMGEFQRFQLLRRDRRGELVPTLRKPDVLRLYRAVLGPGQQVESGTIEVQALGKEPPELRLSGRFLLASGYFLEVIEAPEPDAPP
ncbi:MAG: hypothetical protein KDD47_05165 [Acidobacteria bacterium]|nr:hypothetical protein [Acidobacteriota bacterium]